MEEQKQTEMLSALMGEGGQDAMKMLKRMQRLQRLMGTPPKEKLPETQKEGFSGSQREKMIFAAIPFLNREYQKELYLVVRLMELRRVLGGELLEARERQQEPPRLRQKKLLQAVGEYVSAQERGQLQRLVRMMDMKELLEGEEWK